MSTMFTDVNEKTSEIAAQVGRTPQNWNSSVFSMIQNLSESVVVPIAGIIITLVLCYELISMLTERNNLHDVDTWMFFKYFVKAWVAIYLVSNTFTITMAVFDVGQSVVNSASGIINGETAIDVSSLSMQMQAAMATMEIGELEEKPAVVLPETKPEPEPDVEIEEPEQDDGKLTKILAIVFVMGVGGAGAFFYFYIYKPKQSEPEVSKENLEYEALPTKNEDEKAGQDAETEE